MAVAGKNRKKTSGVERGSIVFGTLIIVLLVAMLALILNGMLKYSKAVKNRREASGQEVEADDGSSVMEVVPTYTPAPTPTPMPQSGAWQVGEIASSAVPNSTQKLQIITRVYDKNGTLLDDGAYAAEEQIRFGTADEYSQLEGITTFRGNHYRDTASVGSIGGAPSGLSIDWSVRIGEIDEWSGVGWTGQCAIVRWPSETVQIMNIYPEKKQKADLVEIIYATLDGNIYFLDLDDGSYTRDPIKVGAPIKGSVTVDPRGYPLLYCGQGIEEVHGNDVPIGTRIFSLIDGSVLYFLDGHDPLTFRKWYAFDCSPLVDGDTDTMILLGENAITYIVKLNTTYDPQAGTISIRPEITRYLFKTDVSTRPGMENSMVIYNHYVYFPDNSGFLQCLDLDTLQPLWVAYVDDDTDSTPMIEEEEPGHVALYTGCELDLRGSNGNIYIRKFDALTGEELWKQSVYCRTNGDTDGGAFATPAMGKGSLGDLVYFMIARTEDGGTLYALNKHTGEVAWTRNMKKHSWSSPVCVYDDTGRGYVFASNSAGYLKLMDGLTGEFVCEINVDANIEGSPVVWNDTLVVGTRGNRILGIKIR